MLATTIFLFPEELPGISSYSLGVQCWSPWDASTATESWRSRSGRTTRSVWGVWLQLEAFLLGQSRAKSFGIKIFPRVLFEGMPVLSVSPLLVAYIKGRMRIQWKRDMLVWHPMLVFSSRKSQVQSSKKRSSATPCAQALRQVRGLWSSTAPIPKMGWFCFWIIRLIQFQRPSWIENGTCRLPQEQLNGPKMIQNVRWDKDANGPFHFRIHLEHSSDR